jgi:hypothetical protein
VIADRPTTRHNHRVRWLVVSLAVHALVVWLLVDQRDEQPTVVLQPPTPAQVETPPMITTIEIVDLSSSSGGGSSPASQHSSRSVRIGSTRARSTNAWSGLSIKTEGLGGRGEGTGSGTRSGFGFGNGGGVQVARDVPPPPPPPPVSKARPAKLIWPNRDIDVEDESYLFVAKVTVDEQGSVVGARMLTSRPGSRADHAANAIWTFRYAPALDDVGRPIRSTLEQPFQVR